MKYILITYFICLSLTSAYAKAYQLFKKTSDGESIPHSNYKEIVGSFKKGDEIIFSNRKRFKIIKKLGEGNTTTIYDIGNGKALRIPHTSKSTFNFEGALMFHKGYLEGAKKLKGLKKLIPKVYFKESLKGEYIVVEKIEAVRFTLSDFLSFSKPYDDYIELGLSNDTKILNELEIFAKKIKRYEFISDFNPTQIAYTKRGWMLLDWDSSVQKSNLITQLGSFFSTKFWGDPAKSVIENSGNIKRWLPLRRDIKAGDFEAVFKFLEQHDGYYDIQKVSLLLKQAPDKKALEAFLLKLFDKTKDDNVWYHFIWNVLKEGIVISKELTEKLVSTNSKRIFESLRFLFDKPFSKDWKELRKDFRVRQRKLWELAELEYYMQTDTKGFAIREFYKQTFGRYRKELDKSVFAKKHPEEWADIKKTKFLPAIQNSNCLLKELFKEVNH